jgi:hypothetical protein
MLHFTVNEGLASAVSRSTPTPGSLIHHIHLTSHPATSSYPVTLKKLKGMQFINKDQVISAGIHVLEGIPLEMLGGVMDD